MFDAFSARRTNRPRWTAPSRTLDPQNALEDNEGLVRILATPKSPQLCDFGVKLEGDFIWHDHKDTDETFIVLEGVSRIDFRDGAVQVSAGEMFVVPKGVEHKPYAEGEVKLLLIEPRGVLNTGHEGGDRTAENDVWI